MFEHTVLCWTLLYLHAQIIRPNQNISMLVSSLLFHTCLLHMCDISRSEAAAGYLRRAGHQCPPQPPGLCKEN